MKENNIINENLDNIHEINNYNDLSFKRLQKLQQLIKTETNLKEIRKINFFKLKILFS